MSIVTKSAPIGRVQASLRMPLRVAILNNMPDSALIRTEEEFTSLLHAAVSDRPLEIRMYALPSVLRGEAGRTHIAANYLTMEALYRQPPDALIVTGTEPLAADLRLERYWTELSALIEWADSCAIPAMFSCLAAHAAVLHLDGIARTPLASKCFGVFRHDVETSHKLMAGVAHSVALPHTRWNGLETAALEYAGYDILCHSDTSGIGMFARTRGATWLFCQAHPEYAHANLLREYRRDVRRFLRRDRATYPELPQGYFSEGETQLLIAFRHRAIAQMDPRALEAFPLVHGVTPSRQGWRNVAAQVFANWLNQSVVTPSVVGIDAAIRTH